MSYGIIDHPFGDIDMPWVGEIPIGNIPMTCLGEIFCG